MKGKILVLKGQSLYNVLRIAADVMAEAFVAKGYQVTVLDLTLEKNLDNLYGELREKPKLVFSFQALYYDLTLDDEKSAVFGSFEDILFFGHIMDHPIYHSTRIELPHGANMYVGCIDRSHVDYIHMCYPDVKNAIYLQHGGFVPKKIIPYEQRSIDLFFPGSYRNVSEVQGEINELPDVFKNMANLLIRRMIDDPMLTLQDAISSYFDQIKFEHTSAEFELIMNQMHVVDQYIHESTRNNCIRILAENGIKVTVSGSGWENIDPELAPYINIIGSNGLDFFEVLDVMSDSKFVLNHAPTYQNGMHERIFTSMNCGAICLTIDFPIIHEEFIDGQNIVLFTDSKIPLLAERVKELLASPDQAKLIAQSGKEIAMSRHTWAKNAETILKIVGLE